MQNYYYILAITIKYMFIVVNLEINGRQTLPNYQNKKINLKIKYRKILLAQKLAINNDYEKKVYIEIISNSKIYT